MRKGRFLRLFLSDQLVGACIRKEGLHALVCVLVNSKVRLQNWILGRPVRPGLLFLLGLQELLHRFERRLDLHSLLLSLVLGLAVGVALVVGLRFGVGRGRGLVGAEGLVQGLRAVEQVELQVGLRAVVELGRPRLFAQLDLVDLVVELHS